MKNWKRTTAALSALIALLVAGCSQGPDFTSPITVTGKHTTEFGTTYELDYTKGVRGEGWGAVKIKGPADLAEVGDVLIAESGVIRAKRSN